MSEDLETTLRRVTETKVNRRGFLAAAGLTGAAAVHRRLHAGERLVAGGIDRRQRRSRRERRPEHGPECRRGGQLPARR